MKQEIFTVTQNKPLTRDVYEMTLHGDISAITAPGQFVNLLLEGFYLRRPISVCETVGTDTLRLIYKTVGRGTEKMAGMTPGQTVDLLVGLGNGYDLSAAGAHPLLVGGGVGVPPLYQLAKELRAKGKPVTVILGFNTEREIFLDESFRSLGCEVLLATADGSRGKQGFVTDAMRDVADYSYLYTCGPLPMLRAVYDACTTGGEFSFEERMGCGFGACMGCSCKTKSGSKRICKEGPVLKKEEILW